MDIQKMRCDCGEHRICTRVKYSRRYFDETLKDWTDFLLWNATSLLTSLIELCHGNSLEGNNLMLLEYLIEQSSCLLWMKNPFPARRLTDPGVRSYPPKAKQCNFRGTQGVTCKQFFRNVALDI